MPIFRKRKFEHEETREHKLEKLAWTALSSLGSIAVGKRPRWADDDMTFAREAQGFSHKYSDLEKMRDIFKYPSSPKNFMPVKRRAVAKRGQGKYVKPRKTVATAARKTKKQAKKSAKGKKYRKKTSGKVSQVTRGTSNVNSAGQIGNTQKKNEWRLSKAAANIIKAAAVNEAKKIKGIFENQAAGFLLDGYRFSDDPNRFDFSQQISDKLYGINRSVPVGDYNENGLKLHDTDQQVFEFFTPRWVLHAHQQLYEGNYLTPPTMKPPTLLQSTAKNKKIFVHSAFGHIYLKNNTLITKEIIFYFCKPKERLLEGTVLEDLSKHYDDEFVSGRMLNRQGTDSKSIDYQAQRMNRYGFGPSWAPKFAKHWQTVQKKIILEPGARFDFSIDGPRNIYYDMEGWRNEDYDGDGMFPTNIPYYAVQGGYGLYGFYTIKNIEVLGAEGLTNNTPNTLNHVSPTIHSSFDRNTNAPGTHTISKSFGVTCRVKHYYMISPDEKVDEDKKIQHLTMRVNTAIPMHNQKAYNDGGTEWPDPLFQINRVDPVNRLTVTLNQYQRDGDSAGPLAPLGL